jgi:hypothetical protein
MIYTPPETQGSKLTFEERYQSFIGGRWVELAKGPRLMVPPRLPSAPLPSTQLASAPIASDTGARLFEASRPQRSFRDI